jgi:hypothetical protein
MVETGSFAVVNTPVIRHPFIQLQTNVETIHAGFFLIEGREWNCSKNLDYNTSEVCRPSSRINKDHANAKVNENRDHRSNILQSMINISPNKKKIK